MTGSNRTFMELKLRERPSDPKAVNCSNRTFMELKYHHARHRRTCH